MNIRDSGIILETRAYLEYDLLVTIFLKHYGRYNGIVKNARFLRINNPVQIGNIVEASWQGRSEEHLGIWRLENSDDNINLSSYFDDSLVLYGINSLTSVLLDCSLEKQKEQDSNLFEALLDIYRYFENDEIWLPLYIRWELELLKSVGLALDLSRCAITDSTDNLQFVSPKTGRAVTKDGAGIYVDKLLKLPPFLLLRHDGVSGERYKELSSTKDIWEQINEGLSLTEYFLSKFLYNYRNKKLSSSRIRLSSLVRKRAER